MQIRNDLKSPFRKKNIDMKIAQLASWATWPLVEAQDQEVEKVKLINKSQHRPICGPACRRARKTLTLRTAPPPSISAARRLPPTPARRKEHEGHRESTWRGKRAGASPAAATSGSGWCWRRSASPTSPSTKSAPGTPRRGSALTRSPSSASSTRSPTAPKSRSTRQARTSLPPASFAFVLCGPARPRTFGF
jgi:hypothetical protein